MMRNIIHCNLNYILNLKIQLLKSSILVQDKINVKVRLNLRLLNLRLLIRFSSVKIMIKIIIVQYSKENNLLVFASVYLLYCLYLINLVIFAPYYSNFLFTSLHS